jgi:RNA polymerase sigma factor (sigma-70 family)
MPSESPDPLVQRAATEFAPDLLRYLARRVRRGTDARDVAQETYVRLLRLERKDLIREPLAYVYRLAANLIHELDLQKGTDDARLSKWMRDRADDVPIAVDAEADAHTLRARIDEALLQLSPKCRAVLIFHRRDGMTYEEIGARLGISSGMVKKYLATALRHCRKRLRDLI